MKKKIYIIVIALIICFIIGDLIFLLTRSDVRPDKKESVHENNTNVSIVKQDTGNKVLPLPENSVSKETSAVSVSMDEGSDNTEVLTDEEKPLPEETISEETQTVAGEAHGKLSVSGTHIVDENGNIVQLKGLSTHGIAWYPEYVNKNLFKEIKETWNCNVVRLAMYTEEYGGYCSGGDKNNLLTLIDNGVSYATEYDMYVIIDWHILSDGDPNKNKTHAIPFFEYVSAKYKDNPHVLYEICNEPNGGVSWDSIKSYALDIIPVIRKNSPDSIIIVGTPTWSQEVDKAAAKPITEYDNIMYALHYYADTHKNSLRSTMEKALKNGLPIFVTEYGICDASGNGAINEKEANLWMELLDKYYVSSCAWNISNKGETSAIFKSSCSKKYGFTDSDLSDSGKWVYKMLTGKNTYESISVSYNNETVTSTAAGGESVKPDINAPEPTPNVVTTGPVSVTLTATGSWESEGKKYTQYNIVVTNNNTYDINSWSEDISFSSKIELSQGWCANYEVKEAGNILHISNVEYNGYIKAGDSTKDIGCILIE